MQTPTTVSLTGVLEKILFFNEENHYCIGELRSEIDSATITVTGVLPNVQCGETLKLAGGWTHHPQYGAQFKVTESKSTLPASVYGIRKYLGSGLVPGIGKVYANKIVDAFGEKTFEIISHESARLRDVPGIGAQRAKAIKQAWDEQVAVREVMLFLKTYGVGNAQCLRLVKNYGLEATEVLKENPYQIAREIRGIGFKTADQIALNLGFPNESPKRVRAGILFSLDTYETEGHTGIPQAMLEERAMELLQVETVHVATELSALLKKGELICNPTANIIQTKRLFEAERFIEHHLLRLQNGSSSLPPVIIKKALEWAEARAEITFAPEQNHAIETALSNKISVITGGPGTGKTTLLRALVSILKAKKSRVLLAAPTGRAAQRMAEASGGYAQTIHRMLKYNPAELSNMHCEERPLYADILIVDEASMLDTMLTEKLLAALPEGAHLVLIGDIHQLPSVGAGNVLKNIIESERFPVTTLSQVFRQGKRSSIVGTAHSILAGNAGCSGVSKTLAEVTPKQDLHFIEALTPEDCVDKITQLCSKNLPQWYGKNAFKQTQILAPMHKGSAGIGNINVILQDALNPSNEKINMGKDTLKRGDKVLQTRNNYDKNVFNGDLGSIDRITQENGSLEVEFSGQPVEYERLDLSELQLAYAISIHKSQGSEFPIVIIPVLKQHYIMLQRNLLYTAITRGRKKVFLVGDPSAYAMGVRNAESARRYTGLLR